MNIRRLAAAAGFATGAALAFAPIASADTSSDWLSTVDGLFGGASPATTSVTDFQISFNGMDLLPTAGNEATATTVAGEYGLAIAFGDGASATAEGGIGDYALASGTDAYAAAGDSASGATGSNLDSAIDIGNNDGPNEGAFAGAGDLIPNNPVADGGIGSNDTAIDIGNNTGTEYMNAFNGYDGAYAGAGGLIGASGNGNGDTAVETGNLTGFGNGPAAVDGNYDYASDSGNTGTVADPAFHLGSLAGFGNNDIATVVGGTSTATAGGGFEGPLSNFDIATVFDPTGVAGSSADAGALGDVAGSYDFAGAFADELNAVAQGADYLFQILPSLF